MTTTSNEVLHFDNSTSCPYSQLISQPVVIRASTTGHVLNHIRPEDTVKYPIPVVSDAHVVLVDNWMFLCPCLREDLPRMSVEYIMTKHCVFTYLYPRAKPETTNKSEKDRVSPTRYCFPLISVSMARTVSSQPSSAFPRISGLDGALPMMGWIQAIIGGRSS